MGQFESAQVAHLHDYIIVLHFSREINVYQFVNQFPGPLNKMKVMDTLLWSNHGRANAIGRILSSYCTSLEKHPYITPTGYLFIRQVMDQSLIVCCTFGIVGWCVFGHGNPIFT